ncbi:30S ribosomal protein S17 [Candidatus Woesearchaeota archaeon]|nr:MAG: 30S ribosomal protein S17 [Candidatus Woesearchaeota archaeon]
MTNAKNIGLDVKAPEKTCDDENCPFHGSLKVRGRQFVGTVVSDKTHKTVVVEWERRKPIQKYERYEKRRSRVQAHNPPCIDASHGDKVLIAECRPLSKTKHFVVIQVLGLDEAKLIKEFESDDLPKTKKKKEAEDAPSEDKKSKEGDEE